MLFFSHELFSCFLFSSDLFLLTSYPVMASLLAHSSYLTWCLFPFCTLPISGDTLPFSWTLLVPSLLTWFPLLPQHFLCDLFLPLLPRSLLADLFSLASPVIASVLACHIIFFILICKCSLLVYWNSFDLYMLIYPANSFLSILKSLISSRRFCRFLGIFYIDHQCHLQIETILFLFKICTLIPFLTLLCWLGFLILSWT